MCVSKARLGAYVGTLSASDMRAIDEAIAKTTGLMSYYADVKKQLNDKLTYIERIKAERNEAQDTLVEICSLLGLGEAPDKEELLVILKKHIEA